MAAKVKERRRKDLLDDVPIYMKAEKPKMSAHANPYLADAFAAERSESRAAKGSKHQELKMSDIRAGSAQVVRARLEKMNAALQKEWGAWYKF